MDNDKKFVEVLTEVVRELMGSYNEGDIKLAEKRVVESLVKKGYELSEISDMLENIFSLINTDNKVSDVKMRVIHPVEYEKFSDEAREYFLGLRSSCIIDEVEFEELMGYFSGLNHKIDIAFMRSVLEKRGIKGYRVLN